MNEMKVCVAALVYIWMSEWRNVDIWCFAIWILSGIWKHEDKYLYVEASVCGHAAQRGCEKLTILIFWFVIFRFEN